MGPKITAIRANLKNVDAFVATVSSGVGKGSVDRERLCELAADFSGSFCPKTLSNLYRC